MSKGRIEKLADRLQARTDHQGKALKGYEQNAAAIKAKIAILQEQMEQGQRADG